MSIKSIINFSLRFSVIGLEDKDTEKALHKIERGLARHKLDHGTEKHIEFMLSKSTHFINSNFEFEKNIDCNGSIFLCIAGAIRDADADETKEQTILWYQSMKKYTKNEGNFYNSTFLIQDGVDVHIGILDYKGDINWKKQSPGRCLKILGSFL